MGALCHFGGRWPWGRGEQALGGQRWLPAPAPPRFWAGGSGTSQRTLPTTLVPLSFAPEEQSPRQVPLCEPTFFPLVSQTVREGGASPVTQTRCRQEGHLYSETGICSQTSRSDKAGQRMREGCYRGEGRGPDFCWAHDQTLPSFEALCVNKAPACGSWRPTYRQWKK